MKCPKCDCEGEWGRVGSCLLVRCEHPRDKMHWHCRECGHSWPMDPVDEILALASAHAAESDDPDHEVGDLQDALRLAFHWLTPHKQRDVAEEMREASASWRE